MSPLHTNEGDRGYVALPSANETPAFRGVSVKGEIYIYIYFYYTLDLGTCVCSETVDLGTFQIYGNMAMFLNPMWLPAGL